jgi:hypothetical protein
MIQVAKDGRYVLNYSGQLTSVGLAKSLTQGKLSKKKRLSASRKPKSV